jgi:hypothetical protein
LLASPSNQSEAHIVTHRAGRLLSAAACLGLIPRAIRFDSPGPKRPEVSYRSTRSPSLVSTKARNSRSEARAVSRLRGNDCVVILVTVDRAERCQGVKVLKLVWQLMTGLRQKSH